MTITEATAVNVVLVYVLAAKQAFDALGVKPALEIDVLGSAAHLAAEAHRALQFGLDGAQVRDLWDGAQLPGSAKKGGR